ncbi:hypothetical protein B484DRAFT_459771 [Ochromonadaceae sp. CCMP2298]|nr:hypothetical protein B484DRAFT_459771 [Ochromonadaceae sp. CCMP2298]
MGGVGQGIGGQGMGGMALPVQICGGLRPTIFGELGEGQEQGQGQGESQTQTQAQTQTLTQDTEVSKRLRHLIRTGWAMRPSDRPLSVSVASTLTRCLLLEGGGEGGGEDRGQEDRGCEGEEGMDGGGDREDRGDSGDRDSGYRDRGDKDRGDRRDMDRGRAECLAVAQAVQRRMRDSEQVRISMLRASSYNFALNTLNA